MEILLIILLAIVATSVTLILISSTTFWRSIYGKHHLVTSQNLVLITGCDTGKIFFIRMLILFQISYKKRKQCFPLGFGHLLALALTKLGYFVAATVLTKEGKTLLHVY